MRHRHPPPRGFARVTSLTSPARCQTGWASCSSSAHLVPPPIPPPSRTLVLGERSLDEISPLPQLLCRSPSLPLLNSDTIGSFCELASSSATRPASAVVIPPSISSAAPPAAPPRAAGIWCAASIAGAGMQLAHSVRLPQPLKCTSVPSQLARYPQQLPLLQCTSISVIWHPPQLPSFRAGLHCGSIPTLLVLYPPELLSVRKDETVRDSCIATE